MLPSGPYGGMHLYVIMTNKCRNNHHLLISISTIRENKFYDLTCVLTVIDHEFINNDSYVYYKEPLKRHANNISKCVDSGLFAEKSDIKSSVFRRICDGIAASQFTPRWAVEYYQENI